MEPKKRIYMKILDTFVPRVEAKVRVIDQVGVILEAKCGAPPLTESPLEEEAQTPGLKEVPQLPQFLSLTSDKGCTTVIRNMQNTYKKEIGSSTTHA